jgi:hypothetical protein
MAPGTADRVKLFKENTGHGDVSVGSMAACLACETTWQIATKFGTGMSTTKVIGLI